jgi:beta-glucosidase
VGSILSGAGGNPVPNTPKTWAEMVGEFEDASRRSRLGIPLLYGVDAVHGHTNVYGATVFPHNIGLGATRDPDLVRRVAQVTADELIATGVHWDFAPAVSVPQDIRWGRTLEAYSEDVDLVTELSMAFLCGLQQEEGANGSARRPLLGCVKHFVADGGTTWGSAAPDAVEGTADDSSGLAGESSDERRRVIDEFNAEFGVMYEHGTWGQQLDQGDADISEQELRRVHLPPYVAAIANGARSIMVSLSSWRGSKLHAHRYLLTDVLKGDFGFDGFLVSDWLGLEYLGDDYYEAVVLGINAGLDMVMVPHDWEQFVEALIRAAESGDVPMERIDDAVRRILQVKAELGLFDGVSPDPGSLEAVGSIEHRRLAREAVAKSVVLLQNDGALPLRKDVRHLYVAGEAASDIGLQCGGWTIEWRGIPGGDIPGSTLLQAVAEAVTDETQVVYDAAGDFDGPMADVGLVVVAEPPYAEMTGDRADLTLPPGDIELIERMRSHCRTLVGVIYAGRPLLVTAEASAFDALVMAWLPGSEGAGIADVLFGDVPFTAKLPFAWPRNADQVPLAALEGHPESPLWPRGHGLEG